MNTDPQHCPPFVSRPDVEEFRYPRADTANATSTLKLLRFVLGPKHEIWDCETFELLTPLRQAQPRIVPVPTSGVVDPELIYSVYGSGYEFLELRIRILPMLFGYIWKKKKTTNYRYGTCTVSVIFSFTLQSYSTTIQNPQA